MSFFNKVLASVGIGSAKVDTILEKDTYTQGETVKGIVHVQGGSVKQDIHDITLTIKSEYKSETSENEVYFEWVIDQHLMVKQFTIEPNDYKEFPFSFELPFNTPVSLDKTRVWVETDLGIDKALDQEDKDLILVKPTPLVNSILSTVQALGFKLREVECVQSKILNAGKHPIVQEFEFIPSTNSFRGILDELEVSMLQHSADEVELFIEVDRKVRGFGSFIAEEFGMDESTIRLTVTSETNNLQNQLYSIIHRHS